MNHYHSHHYRKIKCGNCGKKGHIYKDCVSPVMSMGLICIRYDKKRINDIISKGSHHLTTNTTTSKQYPKIKYLLICRKHSTAFVEFIRGKYEITKPEYLLKLFERMTLIELMLIIKSTYKELYTDLWQNNVETQYYMKEYIKASAKFNSLKDGYTLNDKHLTLDNLINSIECEWTEPEWGFPKGRRNNNESDFQCAIREFKEETDLLDKDFTIINMDPISETYTSVNKIRYKHTYYLSQASDDISPLKISETNKHQVVETSDIGWFTYEEAITKIRNYQVEKLKVLEKVHKTLKSVIILSNTPPIIASPTTTSTVSSTASPTSSSLSSSHSTITVTNPTST